MTERLDHEPNGTARMILARRNCYDATPHQEIKKLQVKLYGRTVDHQVQHDAQDKRRTRAQ